MKATCRESGQDEPAPPHLSRDGLSAKFFSDGIQRVTDRVFETRLRLRCCRHIRFRVWSDALPFPNERHTPRLSHKCKCSKSHSACERSRCFRAVTVATASSLLIESGCRKRPRTTVCHKPSAPMMSPPTSSKSVLRARTFSCSSIREGSTRRSNWWSRSACRARCRAVSSSAMS